MPKTHTSDVFISYATQDKPRLGKVIGELKRRGILEEQDKIIDNSEVFLAGSTVRDNLRKTIQDADKVIIWWSDASAMSDWVNYEAGMAYALGKPTVFVVSKGGRTRLPRSLMEDQVVEID